MNCRFCGTALQNVFIDMVNAPPSNAFLGFDQLNLPETYYPLKLYVCHDCFLVQIDEYKKSAEIFNDGYIYFSSYSTSWLKHADNYVEMITRRLSLNEKSFVMEVASNDGYLLQYFQKKKIPCLGIEPTRGTAQVAIDKGIDVIVAFFGVELSKKMADQDRKADLIIGNNVFAHVPDIADFVRGLKYALKADGVITLEFPHLMKLMENNQFDTIYHEHFSYFSLTTASRILDKHGLSIFDVETLPTHGGSLRIYAKHAENQSIPVEEHVCQLLRLEKERGFQDLKCYNTFQAKADGVKNQLLLFLIEQKAANRKVVAYGAAAKGNTLLNYCGIKQDLIHFVVDASPLKQGKYLPGSHIPVVHEALLRECKPDFVIILPWNIQEEIMNQLSYIREWGGRFVVPVPDLHVI